MGNTCRAHGDLCSYSSVLFGNSPSGSNKLAMLFSRTAMDRRIFNMIGSLKLSAESLAILKFICSEIFRPSNSTPMLIGKDI